MDTKEDIEIQEAQRKGHPETDEGPYYHESWWESYKGSVKGKLGGAVIGALMGAAIGVAAAIAIPFFGGALLTAGALAMTVSGFAAAGMLYGAHEFADVGRVAGGVAAGLEVAEQRQNKKLEQLEKKIDKLQASINGEEIPADDVKKEDKDKKADGELDYKTTHCDEEHCIPNGKPQLIFWKVALIGLAVGLAAGALLASGGLAAHALVGLGVAAEAGALSTTGVMAASMLTMGLFGASFGVNRDLFRHVFDKTDLWFRGIVSKNKKPEAVHQPASAPKVSFGPEHAESTKEAPVTTVVYENQPQYPASETYHRDKVMASAKQALLSMDHTKALPN
jgi:hypothetical protein